MKMCVCLNVEENERIQLLVHTRFDGTIHRPRDALYRTSLTTVQSASWHGLSAS